MGVSPSARVRKGRPASRALAARSYRPFQDDAQSRRSMPDTSARPASARPSAFARLSPADCRLQGCSAVLSGSAPDLGKL